MFVPTFSFLFFFFFQAEDGIRDWVVTGVQTCALPIYGNPVRLRELGRVLDSVENDKTAAWYVDQRSMVLAIQRQPGTNTVEVVDAVKQLLPSFRKQLPAAVEINELYDRSASIRDSVQDVKFT